MTRAKGTGGAKPQASKAVRMLTAVIAEAARRAVELGADPAAVVDAVVAASETGTVDRLEELAPAARPPIEVILMREGVTMPGYRSDDAIAWDVAYPGPEPVTIEAGRKAMLGTGLRIHVPDPDVGAFLHMRSSTGWKGLMLANTTGVIDPDFQGELRLALRNTRRRKSITVMPGDRVAQLVFVPVTRFAPVAVDEFSTETARGHGAFGSTGR